MATIHSTIDSWIKQLPQKVKDDILEWTLIASLPRERILSRFDTYNANNTTVHHYFKLWPAAPGSTDDKVTHISWDYSPPVGLQISSAIREKFAKTYYSGRLFFVFDDDFELRACRRWLLILTLPHRTMIR